VVTDLVQIRMLGDKKRDENFRFRSFVKSNSHSDLPLRRIAQEIEEQIDCMACANCCKVATVTMSERDVARLAKFLRTTPARLKSDYMVESADEGWILRRSEDSGCVFLDGRECTVYEARPDTCQRFPHLVRGSGSIASRMWQFVDRASYCPIVYNSLEAFKEALRFRR
jgi:Fe-S-cluster containining protein